MLVVTIVKVDAGYPAKVSPSTGAAFPLFSVYERWVAEAK